QTAAFNAREAGSLATAPGFTGHPVVSQTNGPVIEGSRILATDLVLPTGPVGDLKSLGQGNTVMMQLHRNLGALLTSLQQRFGDGGQITSALNAQIVAALGPAVAGLTVAVIWLDPVSIDLVDPQGARTTTNLQTNTVTNNLSQAFVQTGGN